MYVKIVNSNFLLMRLLVYVLKWRRLERCDFCHSTTAIDNLQLKSCQIGLQRTSSQFQETYKCNNVLILLEIHQLRYLMFFSPVLINNKKGWRRIAIWKTMTNNIRLQSFVQNTQFLKSFSSLPTLADDVPEKKCST